MKKKTSVFADLWTVRYPLCLGQARRDLNDPENAMLGAFAGAVTGVLTTPLDVIKTRLMVQVCQIEMNTRTCSSWMHFISQEREQEALVIYIQYFFEIMAGRRKSV